MGDYRAKLEPWQAELNRTARARAQERREADRKGDAYPSTPLPMTKQSATDAMIARRAAARVAMRATLDRLRTEYGTECQQCDE